MEKYFLVGSEQTAKALGSGSLPVYGTPALVAAIENTCFEELQPSLEEGFTSVGGSLQLQHLAPSPIGAKIMVQTQLLEVTGKKHLFSFEVFEEERLVSHGQHVRFVVNIRDFLDKL